MLLFIHICIYYTNMESKTTTKLTISLIIVDIQMVVSRIIKVNVHFILSF